MSVCITNVSKIEKVEVSVGVRHQPLTVGDVLRFADSIRAYGHIPDSTRVVVNDNCMRTNSERRIDNEHP